MGINSGSSAKMPKNRSIGSRIIFSSVIPNGYSRAFSSSVSGGSSLSFFCFAGMVITSHRADLIISGCCGAGNDCVKREIRSVYDNLRHTTANTSSCLSSGASSCART